MHYLINLIVKADSAEDALENAETFAGELCGEGSNFDWYNMDGRWGKAKAYKFASNEGKNLIADAMKSTRAEFDSALKHVRYILEHYSGDDIYNEQFKLDDGVQLPEGVHWLSRWQLSRAGGYGNSCYVYAEGAVWGGRIENDRELEVATKAHDDLWVVPVDFHS